MEKGYVVFIAFIIGWLIAQLSKVLIEVANRRGRFSLNDLVELLMKSGGMPSSHTASLTAVAIMIGYLDGFNSTIFALSICVLIIVMYDAINVRFAVGEHGKILNKIIKEGKYGLQVKIVAGHRLPEVVAGLLVGLVASAITTMVLLP